jgi:hypothetical protein
MNENDLENGVLGLGEGGFFGDPSPAGGGPKEKKEETTPIKLDDIDAAGGNSDLQPPKAGEGSSGEGGSDGGGNGQDGNPGTGDGTQPDTGGAEAGYGEMLKELYQRGVIDNPDEVEVKDGEGNPVEITAENIFDVIGQLAKSKMESRFSELSDFTKALIEIEEKGGSIDDLIAFHNSAIAPLKNMDVSTEAGRMAVLKHYYQLQGNREEEEIDTLIESYRARNLLEEKAEKAKEVIEAEKVKRIEAAKAEQEKRETGYREFVTRYRRDISKAFAPFQLSEAARKKLVDASIQRDRDGKYGMQKRFMEVWNNPSEAAHLVYFLNDPQGYREHIASGRVADATRRIARTIMVTNKNRHTAVKDDADRGSKDHTFAVDGPEE